MILISMNIINVMHTRLVRGLGLGLGLGLGQGLGLELGLGEAQADWSIRGCSTAGGCAAVFLAIAGFVSNGNLVVF